MQNTFICPMNSGLYLSVCGGSQVWRCLPVYYTDFDRFLDLLLGRNRALGFRICGQAKSNRPASCRDKTFLPARTNSFTSSESRSVCVFLVSRVKCVLWWCVLYLGSPPSLRVNTGHFNAGPYPLSPAVTQHSPLLYALKAWQWDWWRRWSAAPRGQE